MTKAITLKKVETVVKPPPTKSEIIEAMVQVRIENVLKEQAEKEKERKDLETELRPLLLAYALKNQSSLPASVDFGQEEQKWEADKGYLKTGRISGCDVTLKLDRLPASIEKKLIRLAKIPTYFGKPNPVNIRKQIKQAMSGYAPAEERVKALVADTESKKALNATLKAIGL